MWFIENTDLPCSPFLYFLVLVRQLLPTIILMNRWEEEVDEVVFLKSLPLIMLHNKTKETAMCMWCASFLFTCSNIIPLHCLQLMHIHALASNIFACSTVHQKHLSAYQHTCIVWTSFSSPNLCPRNFHDSKLLF